MKDFSAIEDPIWMKMTIHMELMLGLGADIAFIILFLHMCGACHPINYPGSVFLLLLVVISFIYWKQKGTFFLHMWQK